MHHQTSFTEINIVAIMAGIDAQPQPNADASSSAMPFVYDSARRWAKMSLIAGAACWTSIFVAFLLPFLMMPLLMSGVTSSANSPSSAGTPASAQAAIFISAAAMVGYPIGMVIGVIGLVAGIVALRKGGSDPSATRSKNLALAGVALGGASLVVSFILACGIWVFAVIPAQMFPRGTGG